MGNLLFDYQYNAVNKMKNGCILNGKVGSGKSITGLYYYFKEQGGINKDGIYKKMTNPKNLYIITTAAKRDSCEWEMELARYSLSIDSESSGYCNSITIDSWNNITKYVNVKNAFFIFDEDKVTGYGVWAKTFIKITKNNDWIILSATPGDTWLDYAPVFIANGYFKNMTEFKNEHVIYDRFVTKYPKINGYRNTGKLMRLRNRILIEMDDLRKTHIENIDILCDYNRVDYKELFKYRWNKEEDRPIENTSELCYKARQIVNSDISRSNKIIDILNIHDKAIIFYNFDYELDILKNILTEYSIPFSERNGHKHQDILIDENQWAYLVQYNAGAEAWNCISTDTMIFYSQNYSYKIMEQASGRINRTNTPFVKLYYYHLKSRSPIDIAIGKALSDKKKFNESRFIDKIT